MSVISFSPYEVGTATLLPAGPTTLTDPPAGPITVTDLPVGNSKIPVLLLDDWLLIELEDKLLEDDELED